MDRSIEFIALDKNLNKVRNVTEINFLKEQVCLDDSYCRNFNDVILLQYTGKKDMNNEKLYECDIVCLEQWTPTNYVIRFVDGCFNLVSYDNSIYIPIDMIEDSMGNYATKIGNILINKGKHNEV